MDVCRLFCIASTLLSFQHLTTATVDDFDDKNTVTGWDFIYHGDHGLVLTVFKDRCYYTSLRTLYANRVLDGHGRRTTELLLYQLINRSPTRAVRSSLNEMREIYHDVLADFHCANKQVFRLPVHGDDFIRAGIIDSYADMNEAQTAKQTASDIPESST